MRLNFFHVVHSNEMNLSSRVLNLSSVKGTIFKLQIVETFISINSNFNMNFPLATVFVTLLCVIVSRIFENLQNSAIKIFVLFCRQHQQLHRLQMYYLKKSSPPIPSDFRIQSVIGQALTDAFKMFSTKKLMMNLQSNGMSQKLKLTISTLFGIHA